MATQAVGGVWQRGAAKGRIWLPKHCRCHICRRRRSSLRLHFVAVAAVTFAPPLSPASLLFWLLIVRLSVLPMPHRRHIFVVFVVEVEAPFLCPFPLPLLPIAAYAPPSSSASLATPLAAAAGAFILMMSQYRIWGRATVGQKKNGTEAQNGTNRHKPAQIFKLAHIFWGG